MKKHKQNMLLFIRNNFIAGVTILLPLWAVILVVRFIVAVVNDKWLTPIIKILQPYIKWADPQFLSVSIKWAIFVSILFLIMILGVLVKNLFVRKLIGVGEKYLMRIPLINKVYIAMQQISQTFLVKKQAMFRQTVLVEYPHKGKYVIAFTTTDKCGEIQTKIENELTCVFIPTTPNPTSGFLLFVPKDDVIELTMSIEDAFKAIISFGAIIPEAKEVLTSQT